MVLLWNTTRRIRLLQCLWRFNGRYTRRFPSDPLWFIKGGCVKATRRVGEARFTRVLTGETVKFGVNRRHKQGCTGCIAGKHQEQATIFATSNRPALKQLMEEFEQGLTSQEFYWETSLECPWCPLFWVSLWSYDHHEFETVDLIGWTFAKETIGRCKPRCVMFYSLA